MKDRQTKLAIEKHNDEVRELNEEFANGRPSRVPVHLETFNERFFIMDPEINIKRISWRDVCENADAVVAMRTQITRWRYAQERFFSDIPLHTEDLPEVWPSFSPYYESAHEAATFGAEVYFPTTGDNPDNRYLFENDDEKWSFQNIGYDIDPEGVGHYGRCIKIWKELREKVSSMRIDGSPVQPPVLPYRMYAGDGPFTIACALRGVAVMCDMLEDPAYFHALMDWITKGIILRGKTTREYETLLCGDYGFPKDSWFFSEDSAAMLSPEMYEQMVLPYNLRVLEAFYAPEVAGGIHMCGDALHLFGIMKEAFNVNMFDTGFPCDLGFARKVLGPDIVIYGNITPALLYGGDRGEINGEVLGILRSGVANGRRFILHDGTNLAPRTPMDNLVSCYEFGKEMGVYTGLGDEVAAVSAPGKSILPWANYQKIRI